MPPTRYSNSKSKEPVEDEKTEELLEISDQEDEIPREKPKEKKKVPERKSRVDYEMINEVVETFKREREERENRDREEKRQARLKLQQDYIDRQIEMRVAERVKLNYQGVQREEPRRTESEVPRRVETENPRPAQQVHHGGFVRRRII